MYGARVRPVLPPHRAARQERERRARPRRRLRHPPARPADERLADRDPRPRLAVFAGTVRRVGGPEHEPMLAGRECRIALGQSQAAFAAMLGVSPESYRTWDAGRRATPLKILARARALATHRDDHANFRVCTDEEIALLSDADPGNNPPQSGCIYEDQALIRPDTTINYEAGVRRSWRDGRFSANGTLFHVAWEDIQVTGLTPFSSQPITLNGGGAVSRGVELAGAAGLTNALRFRGSWSYTHAELSQDSPGLLEDGADAFEGDRPVPIEAERRGEKKRTKASRDFRRNSASERPIWRVRGRPGRPLRRGRSSACASRLTAIRTAALRVGSPAMVSYPSCRKWYRSHQSNTSASVIWLVGVGLNPRYWGTVRRRHERRCPQLFSGTRAPTADWPAWPGPGARHAR